MKKVDVYIMEERFPFMISRDCKPFDTLHSATIKEDPDGLITVVYVRHDGIRYRAFSTIVGEVVAGFEFKKGECREIIKKEYLVSIGKKGLHKFRIRIAD